MKRLRCPTYKRRTSDTSKST
jgi:hypothetical protein